jgi:hypothetical protein
MSTVYILGAGFSRAIGKEMPLLQDLSVGVYEEMRAKNRWDLNWGTDLKTDVELLASHLISSHPWETPGGRHKGLADYYEVMSIIEERLVTAESGTMLAQKPKDWLEELCSHWLDDAAAVISFNYDTLVERTVAVLDPDGPAMAASLFPAPITPAGSRLGAVLSDSMTKRRFSLLKLHGSLNWWYSGPEAPPGDVVYGTAMHAGWGDDGQSDDVLGTVADKRRLIVPPTLSKDNFYANDILRRQWRVGRAALVEAERIVFLGYSLPHSDLTARLLVATAQTGCVIEVVDLNPHSHRSIRPRLPGFTVEQRFHGEDAIPNFVESL